MLTCNTTRIVKEKCRERKREEQNKINNLICSVEKKTMYDNTYNKNLLTGLSSELLGARV